MYSVRFLLVAIAVGCVRGNPFLRQQPYEDYYDYPEYEYPPQPYYAPGPFYGGKEGRYVGGNVLRKSVHDAQESGLESARRAGGHQLVKVNSAGKDDFSDSSAARGSSVAAAAKSGGAEGFGRGGKGGYSDFGAGGFNKGHSSTGFHKSYSNVESGKDSSFVDEDHKQGGHKYGESFGDAHGETGHKSWEDESSDGGSALSTRGRGQAGSSLVTSGRHQAGFGEAGRRGSFGTDRYLAADSGEGTFRADIGRTSLNV